MKLAATILILLLAQPAKLRPCDTTEGECSDLAANIAEAADTAGLVTGVDPSLLVAIAHHETRFNQERVGRKGRGLWGLNPRSRAYRNAVAQCDIWPEQCTVAQALAAARYLADERRRCGSWDGALRSYGSGRCEGRAGERYLRGLRVSIARIERGAR